MYVCMCVCVYMCVYMHVCVCILTGPNPPPALINSGFLDRSSLSVC